MTQSGTNVVLNLGGTQTLTFAGTTISGQLTASDFALPINLTGWKETFDDEFNTFSASATSHTTTWHIASGTRAANHEAENYSTNLGAGSPFNLSNGVLDITATPMSSAPGLPYTSGDITSQYSLAQTYGFFEISAQLLAGQGMWPRVLAVAREMEAGPGTRRDGRVGTGPHDPLHNDAFPGCRHQQRRDHGQQHVHGLQHLRWIGSPTR